MSQDIVHFFVKTIKDAITQDENNSIFPFRDMFEKILEKIPRNLSRDNTDKVRESVYDLDDILTQCQTFKRQGEHNRSWLNCHECLYFLKTKEKLQTIKKTLQNLSSEPKDGSSSSQQDNEANPMEYQWTSGTVDVSKIYGWDKDVENINKTLLEENRVLNMIGIVGSIGSGKTALAQKIFMSEDIKDAFALRLWVCVSPNCEPKELVLRMLDNLGLEDVDKIITEKAGKRDVLGILLFLLHLQLLNKRYLIVFDDVREVKSWHINLELEPPEDKQWSDRLAYGLPKGNGSAIIVTTRVHEVARKMVGTGKIYYPKRLLGDDDGWLLFKTAFSEKGGKPFDSSLEDMKREITRKCDGLPLALKMAGQEWGSKSIPNTVE